MRNKLNPKQLAMIPIVIAIGIIPLIIRVSVHTDNGQKYADIFLACKAWAIQILMVIMVGIICYRAVQLKEKLPWKKVMMLLALYLLFVLVSAFVFGNALSAFVGSFERFEPVGVIAGYLVIFYYSFSQVKDEEDLRLLIWFSAVFVGLMILLGIMQGMGFDPFNLTFVKKLITPFSLHDKLDNLQLKRDKGVAYLTLYNEDYLGMYFSLIIPVCASLLFAAKSKAGKVIAGGFIIASLYVLAHGRSMGGWISLFLTGIIAVMIVSERSKKGAIISWVCLGLALLAAVLVLKFVPSVRDRVDRELSSSSGRVRKITQVETGDLEVVFYYFDGNELHCSFDWDDNGKLDASFRDKNGDQLAYYDDSGIYTLEERFEYADATVYTWEIEDVRAAMFEIDEHQWPIVLGNGGTYYYLDSDLNEVKAGKVDNVRIFDDGFLSGRGAIWNRALPLLGRHIFFGTGANAFATEYPQDDHVLLNYLYGWGYSEHNVKAHSLYLGNMIENGILGTLCLVGFFVLYVISGVRRYGRKGADHYIYYIKFGLFLGCLAYMISGFINDSNVCTAPIFWAFMGVSVADVSHFT